MVNFLKQMSLLHDIRGRSTLDTPRLINVLESIQIASSYARPRERGHTPLADNATKLEMEQIHVAFKFGAGGTFILARATTTPDGQVGSQAFEQCGVDTERSKSVSQSDWHAWGRVESSRGDVRKGMVWTDKSEASKHFRRKGRVR